MKNGRANCAASQENHGLVKPSGVETGLEGLRRDSSASESDVSEDEESSQSSNLELRLAPSATCAVVTGFPSTAAAFALGGDFLRPSTTGAGAGFGSGERGSAGTSSNDDRNVKPNPPPDAAGGGPIENPKPPPPSGGGIA